ncbi:conserved Plasmodium protein, unknown function [Plasmodium malariae]|uniref:BTB domain-containing protein n=1 Tax=Plasmodium malariae TaxID=5858 RepID=A0A1D3TFC6_PLAMA|nr:conserved Plasmodium protein, unknown function [Plasmodium malariae]SCP03669.1 conserved Plasmodium protein, unknown function [Plasmodium malariae]
MDKFNRDNIISINVGGKIYMTTISLICRYKNSYLYEIILDDHKMKEIFIDRNGNRFEYILDFLRDGMLICENDINVLTKILIEAVYFKLSSLIRIIKKKICLLYCNIGNNVYKKIFKSIINTIEKSKILETDKLNKLGNVSNYGELKYYNVIKKKKKKNDNNNNNNNNNCVHYLNTSNSDNVVCNKSECANEEFSNDICKKNNNSSVHLSSKSFNNEKEIISHPMHSEEERTKEKNDINNNENYVNFYMSYNKERENMNKKDTFINIHTQNKYSDYNITNNFINDVEKTNHSTSIQKNFIIRNDRSDRNENNERNERNERNESNDESFIPLAYVKLKNKDHKYVSFSDKNNIHFYNDKGYTKTSNGCEMVSENLSEKHEKINNIKEWGITNGMNSLNYSTYATSGSCTNYTNMTSDHNESYKYNNYKCNNISNSRNEILVYSEIDDIEETSPFPILSNINLGEQIFSTTVDF